MEKCEKVDGNPCFRFEASFTVPILFGLSGFKLTCCPTWTTFSVLGGLSKRDSSTDQARNYLPNLSCFNEQFLINGSDSFGFPKHSTHLKTMRDWSQELGLLSKTVQ
jgi:hypothetical protein